MKHHYAPAYREDGTVIDFDREEFRGTSHSHCKRCKVKVRVPEGTSTRQFLTPDGVWTSKVPPCLEPK